MYHDTIGILSDCAQAILTDVAFMRGNATILVVEDDPDDRFFVSRIFKRSPFPIHVQFAEDGAEAIDYLLGNGKYRERTKFPIPTLILLDLRMPKVSGLEFLRWIKTKAGLKRLPVTVLSSSVLQSDIDKAYELGANAYLIKPLTFDQLEKVYHRATEFFTVEAEAPAV